MRASRWRTRRYDTRTLARKISVAIASSGTVVSVTSASRQSSHNMAPTMPSRMKRSPSTATTPWANSSFSTDTSWVTRVRI
jgi:hypothetical protein